MSKQNNSVAKELRRAIRQARRRGMTQYKIAKAAGMAQAQLGRIARGENVPTLTTAERIVQAIGCRIVIVAIVVN